MKREKRGMSSKTLSPLERDILREGGASGVEEDNSDHLKSARDHAFDQWERELQSLQGDSVEAEGAAGLLGISPVRMKQELESGKITLFRFREPTGRWLYPRWQFVAGNRIPCLSDFLEALSPEAHPVSVYRFMTMENSDLERAGSSTCLTPRDWLVMGFDPKPVILMAQDI